MLQLLELDIVRCFKQVYRKYLLLNSLCLMDPEKNVKLKINVLQALHFIVAV
jgi:hypothetical protein